MARQNTIASYNEVSGQISHAARQCWSILAEEVKLAQDFTARLLKSYITHLIVMQEIGRTVCESCQGINYFLPVSPSTKGQVKAKPRISISADKCTEIEAVMGSDVLEP